MAEKDKSNSSVEDQLTVGNFVKNEARVMGFTIGGAAAGLGIGKWVLPKIPKFPETITRWTTGKRIKNLPAAQQAEEFAEAMETTKKWYLPLIGTAVGYAFGQIAALYEHWLKVERERLSVQEINTDVANIMGSRVSFEETLDKQQKIIDTMLTKQQSGGMVQKELTRREQASPEQGRT